MSIQKQIQKLITLAGDIYLDEALAGAMNEVPELQLAVKDRGLQLDEQKKAFILSLIAMELSDNCQTTNEELLCPLKTYSIN